MDKGTASCSKYYYEENVCLEDKKRICKVSFLPENAVEVEKSANKEENAENETKTVGENRKGSKRKSRSSYSQRAKKIKSKMKELRINKVYSIKEKMKNRKYKREMRKGEGYQEKVRKINKERMKKLRKIECYREKEKVRNKAGMKKLREDEDYSQREKMKNRKDKKKLREDEEYSRSENERNIASMKKLREDEDYSRKENVRNKAGMKKLREDEDYSRKENVRNKAIMKKLRTNEDYRDKECSIDRAAKDAQRKNEIIHFRHNMYNALLNNDSRVSLLKLSFIKSRKDLPDYVCCSCEGLFFKHSVSNLNIESFKSKMKSDNFDGFYTSIYNSPSAFVCKTCKKYISEMKVPKLATSNGLKFVEIPECVKNLSPLEERMCCPYIPFMQMRPLKSFAVNAQLGVKGSIVNIPIDINDCLRILPRKLDDSATIQVQLKRHLKHKSNYMFETIRPAVICDALNYLKTTQLYISNDIVIDESFLSRYNQQYSEKIEFVVEEKDKQIISLDEESENPDSCNSESEEDDCEEVLLIDRNEATKDDIQIIAPGQNQNPVSWHSIKNFDELCFPKIFCGHPLDLPDFISYSDRAKSECRRVDRRSCVPQRLLFMAKQKIEKQCTANINMCLRKTTKSSKIRAKNLLDPEFVDNLIKIDTGYQFTKEIRSSPAYWEKKKRDLLAMIRQLGKPTLFITLSAAEGWWPELVSALSHLNLNQKITLLDAIQMDKYDKTNLIKNDPVTCARYFNQKICNFMKLIKSQSSIFENHDVLDSYQRVEFQMRGSPHEHMFLWLKDPPRYDASDPESSHDVVSFVDKYITCENDENDPYMYLQKHKHTHTCYKGKKHKKKCRFHFPIPVMPKTTILTPLCKEETTAEVKKNLGNINNITEYFYRKKVAMSFNNILEKLKISEQQYILALRSSVDQPRVFLKRSSLEVGINCYNKDILHLFESNMDIQFILEEYGLASYIINYVSKVESGLSKLLRNAAKDVECGNKSLKDKLRKIANVFLNSNLMSAQEAAYHLLSLPLSKSSRQVFFINTSPRQERVTMLKRKQHLQQLPPDSEDVYMENVIQKYCRRPKSIEKVCLAEFVACHHKSSKNYDYNDDDDGEESKEGKMKTKVIRYRRYKLAQDSTNYYREQILLLLPFRDEIQEIENQNCQELYTKNLEIIESNAQKFSIKSDPELEEILEAVQYNKWGKDEDNDSNEDLHDEEAVDYNVDIFEQTGINDENKKYLNRFSIPKRVTSDKLINILDSLNTRQKEFVNHVLNCYRSNHMPFKIFLSGSAGVGKSTVVNALYQAVTHYFDDQPGGEKEKIVVLLCAPSGKAAFLINGVTLHTAFALPVTQFSGSMPELSCDIANSIREKLFNLKLLIIDEISMVGSRLFSRVDTRLRQIMGKSDPFGGVSVIAVGDLHQLPPVMDSAIYKFVPNEFSALMDRNPLWDSFHFYELTQVMRQKEDLRFVEALNNLARGLTKAEDINLFNTRVVEPADVPVTAVRLFSTNKDVEEYNQIRIQQHTGKCYLSEAKDHVSGKSSEIAKSSIINSLKKKRISEVNGLPHVLNLKIGLKYMLTNNINVEDGLVNGACGVLKKIIFKPGTEEPYKLFLDFGDERVGCEARHNIRSFMKRENLDFHLTPIDLSRNLLNISNKLGFEVVRVQFPLICAEAITIHKSQGQTYNEVCLDFEKYKRISRSMLYVALSRVTKLSGLFLLSTFKGVDPCNVLDPVLEEMKRLRNEKTIKIHPIE